MLWKSLIIAISSLGSIRLPSYSICLTRETLIWWNLVYIYLAVMLWEYFEPKRFEAFILVFLAVP